MPPLRRAKCPDCGRIVAVYTPRGLVPDIDAIEPMQDVFRAHPTTYPYCDGWAKVVPPDAYVDPDAPRTDAKGLEIRS